MSKKGQLSQPWRQIQGAVWLVGLAILFFTGRWWPGILILIAITVVLEAVIRLAVPEAVEPPKAPEEPEPAPLATPVADPPEPQHRADLLPAECAKCGAPARGHQVHWTGPRSADCWYCGSNLPMKQA